MHSNLILEVYFPIPALLSVKYKNPQIYINLYIYIFILKVLLFYNGNKIIFILSKKHHLALGGWGGAISAADVKVLECQRWDDYLL